MIWPLFAILTVSVLLLLLSPLLKNETYSKGLVTVFFAVFLALSLGTYALIGRADLLKKGALQNYEPAQSETMRGPTPEQVQAAQEMSPEDRAEMILAMVEGLAARLEETPKDAQGWQRLIRAREVLGQDEKRAADIARVRDIFRDEPETLALILNSSN